MFESFNVNDIRKARENTHDKIKDLSTTEIIERTKKNAVKFDTLMKEIQEKSLPVK